jgi:ferredoxin
VSKVPKVLLRLLKGRRALQFVLLAIAAALVLHGLLGPQVAPRNLATVGTWIHYRGLLIVALLAVGNLFCASCPMILARDGARRLWHPALRWPRRLRGKWLSIALFAAVLFTYERFDLWALPAATAWLIVGYFAAAIVIDVLFSGATFCKHVCPVGQFSFVASTLSPTELRARDLQVCKACRTVDCIKGTWKTPDRSERPERSERMVLVRRGCELALFMPNKVGNIDCTLCGDCIRACPHDNIQVASRVPGAELLDPRRRSGIGRLAARPDLAALFIVFTAAGLLNAFAMTAPAAALDGAGLGMLFATGLLVPAVVFSRKRLIGLAYALAPLGFGIWLAHYGFHFLTGAGTIVPVAQAAAIDTTGAATLGEPLWQFTGLQPGAVFPMQIGVVLLGAAGSLGLVRALAGESWKRLLPWAAIVLVIAAAALWTFAQPMAMRGMEAMG